jgi:hypothetical protein
MEKADNGVQGLQIQPFHLAFGYGRDPRLQDPQASRYVSIAETLAGPGLIFTDSENPLGQRKDLTTSILPQLHITATRLLQGSCHTFRWNSPRARPVVRWRLISTI